MLNEENDGGLSWIYLAMQHYYCLGFCRNGIELLFFEAWNLIRVGLISSYLCGHFVSLQLNKTSLLLKRRSKKRRGPGISEEGCLYGCPWRIWSHSRSTSYYKIHKEGLCRFCPFKCRSSVVLPSTGEILIFRFANSLRRIILAELPTVGNDL